MRELAYQAVRARKTSPRVQPLWSNEPKKVAMFWFREYAACALLALLVAGLFVAVCGIGYLLKVTGSVGWRAVKATQLRTAVLKRTAMEYSSNKLICPGTEPGAVAD